ncbi:MAG: sigma-70 family RNA polymerase sigma factor [Lentisphaeraceae bacterium]|nr:sigma-70 family RNA polymerase sigma factor [Lentisphaeraceae bacterium]
MNNEEFIVKLTEAQSGLYAYIYTMIGDHNKAKDVLQESNLVMWRKLNDFDGLNFEAWSVTICKFQVMAYFRDKKRDKLLLDSDLAEQVSKTAEKEYSFFNRAEPQLLECLATLPEQNQNLIKMKYFEKLKMDQIASRLDRKLSAVKVAIHRIRKTLFNCIEQKLKIGDS